MTNHAISVRFASVADSERLVTVMGELYEYYFSGTQFSATELLDYLQHQVFAEHSNVQVILAENNEQTVLGFATFSLLYPAPKLGGQVFMKELFTSANHRGQGVGKQLMRFIAQYALQHRCQRLDWTSETTNPNAVQFYHTIGATLVAEKQYFRFEGSALRALADG